MPTYDFKPTSEFFWFLFVTALVQSFQVLKDFDPATITDWKAWAIALGAGAVRAVAGAALGWITKRAFSA